MSSVAPLPLIPDLRVGSCLLCQSETLWGSGGVVGWWGGQHEGRGRGDLFEASMAVRGFSHSAGPLSPFPALHPRRRLPSLVGSLSPFPAYRCPRERKLIANIYQALTMCQHVSGISALILTPSLPSGFCYTDKQHAAEGRSQDGAAAWPQPLPRGSHHLPLTLPTVAHSASTQCSVFQRPL